MRENFPEAYLKNKFKITPGRQLVLFTDYQSTLFRTNSTPRIMAGKVVDIAELSPGSCSDPTFLCDPDLRRFASAKSTFFFPGLSHLAATTQRKPVCSRLVSKLVFIRAATLKPEQYWSVHRKEPPRTTCLGTVGSSGS